MTTEKWDIEEGYQPMTYGIIEGHDFTVKIMYDEDPCSPRIHEELFLNERLDDVTAADLTDESDYFINTEGWKSA